MMTTADPLATTGGGKGRMSVAGVCGGGWKEYWDGGRKE